MSITIGRDSDDYSLIDNEYIDKINNIVTIYGQIPYTIPRKLISEIIKSSARFFYMYYEGAWRKAFFLLTKESIDVYFKDNYGQDFGRIADNSGEVVTSIKLSPRVRIVHGVYPDSRSNYRYNNTHGQTGGCLSYYGSSTLGGSFGLHGSIIDRDLYMIQAVTELVEVNALKSLLHTPFPFSYNVQSNMLQLMKKVDSNMVLDATIDNHISTLYNDSLFDRHVIGCVKRELKRLIASHTIQLPGEATINPDEICNNLEDIERVEEIVKNMSGIGDILLKN